MKLRSIETLKRQWPKRSWIQATIGLPDGRTISFEVDISNVDASHLMNVLTGASISKDTHNVVELPKAKRLPSPKPETKEEKGSYNVISLRPRKPDNKKGREP